MNIVTPQRLVSDHEAMSPIAKWWLEFGVLGANFSLCGVSRSSGLKSMTHVGTIFTYFSASNDSTGSHAVEGTRCEIASMA